MANNIYIGNRYVPVFANPVEWDNLREYEPLTIVTYNGTAYTSRQTVPVGTALSNTEYWVVTGNYNAQVEQYRQEVVAVQDSIDDVASDVSDIQTDVSTLQTAVSNINDELEPIVNKRFVLVGDSYSVGTTAGGTTTGWTTRFKERGNLSSNDCFILDAGGSGFIGNTTTFLSVLNNNYSSVTSRDTITDVVVAGGYNDSGKDIPSLTNAVSTFIARAKELFPNAKIWIGMVGYSSALDSDKRIGMIDCAHCYLDGCINGGANYITNSELLLPTDSWYLMSSDGIHPNSTGYTKMGCLIYDAVVNTGVMSVVPSGLKSVSFTKNNAFSTTNINFYVRVHGTTKTIYMTGTKLFVYTSQTTIAGNTKIELGTFNDTLYGVNSEELTSKPVKVLVQLPDAKFYGTTAWFVIQNGKLYLRFKDTRDSGEASYSSFTNAVQFYILDSSYDYDVRIV